jgi:DNA polymerase-4
MATGGGARPGGLRNGGPRGGGEALRDDRRDVVPALWEGRRAIAHIDMDAFFASVEVLDDPSLKGRPVIVGGDVRRGVVSAASYEARAFGVHSAMPLFQARRLCPNGVYVPVRMERYVEVSRTVMTCLGEFSPLVEQVSVDEAYLDLTGTGHLLGAPEEAARKIKARIAERTSLTCSVGVSVTKLIAKIASDMDKPNGLTVVPPGEVERFLSSLPVGKVPGIGERGREELAKIGIRLVGDLARLAPERLEERFGAFGSWLVSVARGGDDDPVRPYTAPKSISAEDTLSEDTADERTIRRCLLEQSDRIGRRLREEGFRGRTVTLKLKHHDFRQITRSETLAEPTQLGETIYREAVKLLAVYNLRSKVRLVGVGVSNLEPADAVPSGAQMGLFREPDATSEKWDKVERAADEIARRFGDGAVKRGSLLEE